VAARPPRQAPANYLAQPAAAIVTGHDAGCWCDRLTLFGRFARFDWLGL
jgi:hypothetical protein